MKDIAWAIVVLAGAVIFVFANDGRGGYGFALIALGLVRMLFFRGSDS